MANNNKQNKDYDLIRSLQLNTQSRKKPPEKKCSLIRFFYVLFFDVTVPWIFILIISLLSYTITFLFDIRMTENLTHSNIFSNFFSNGALLYVCVTMSSISLYEQRKMNSRIFIFICLHILIIIIGVVIYIHHTVYPAGVFNNHYVIAVLFFVFILVNYISLLTDVMRNISGENK